MRLVTGGRASNSAESEAKGNLRIDFESFDAADGTPQRATVIFQPVWEIQTLPTGLFAGLAQCTQQSLLLAANPAPRRSPLVTAILVALSTVWPCHYP